MGLSGAVTSRFAFGEDHCAFRVDHVSQGRCEEVGEEPVVTVQARGGGGRGGNGDLERSQLRYR